MTQMTHSLTALVGHRALSLPGYRAPLHGEDLVPDPDAVSPDKVGSVHPGLTAQPRQHLTRPHRVSPLIVTAGVILDRETACRPVPRIESVLEINLGLANEVIRTQEIPVINLENSPETILYIELLINVEMQFQLNRI